MSKNVIIEKYNHLLVLETGKTIDLRKSRLIKLVLMNDGILLVKSKYNSSIRSNELYGQKLNFDLKPESAPTFLTSALAREFGDRGNFGMRISDNHKHLSLLYTSKGDDGKFVLHHRLYNAQTFELIHSKDVLLPFLFEDFLIKDFVISNSGKVSYWGKHRIHKKKGTDPIIERRLFEIKDTTVTDYLLSDSISVSSSKLIYDREQDQAKVVGFYGNAESYGVHGSFIYSASDLSSKSLLINKFPASFTNDLRESEQTKGAVSEGFEILRAVPRSDGGMLIIAEQKEVATQDDIILVNGIPQSTSKNVFNYNEVLILNYDSTGFLDWHKVLTKNQTTVNDGGYFSSVVVFIGNDFVQLFYNDQLRNSGDVMQYTVYFNGEEERTKLLKNELDHVAIMPTESRQVSSNKMIIPTAKNRRFAILKLLYN